MSALTAPLVFPSCFSTSLSHDLPLPLSVFAHRRPPWCRCSSSAVGCSSAASSARPRRRCRVCHPPPPAVPDAMRLVRLAGFFASPSSRSSPTPAPSAPATSTSSSSWNCFARPCTRERLRLRPPPRPAPPRRLHLLRQRRRARTPMAKLRELRCPGDPRPRRTSFLRIRPRRRQALPPLPHQVSPPEPPCIAMAAGLCFPRSSVSFRSCEDSFDYIRLSSSWTRSSS
nr:uncharacterized protein LOC109744471 [Aegilops tauschii subsp. strangulata]